MSLTIEDKIRVLAAQDATLQGYLGTSPFRLFDRQLPPGMINSGVCVTAQRVSTIPRMYAQTGLLTLEQPCIRFKIHAWTGKSNARIMSNAPATARAVRDALISWLANTACFSSSAQFDSPSTSPPNHPNFVLNEVGLMDYDLDPPGYMEVIDVRVMNLSN